MNFAEIPAIIWIIVALGLIACGGHVMDWVGDLIQHRRKLALERAKAALPQPPPLPVCQCKHGLSFHDPVTGRCTAEVERVTRWETRKFNEDEEPEFDQAVEVGRHLDTVTDEGYVLLKIPQEWALAPCGCLRYVGPEPLITLSAPDLTPLAVEQGHGGFPPPAAGPPSTGSPRGGEEASGVGA